MKPVSRTVATLVLLLTVGAAPGITRAEDPPASPPHEDRPYWRHNLFRRVFSDQKFLVTQWWPEEFKNPAFSIPLSAAVLAAATSQGSVEHSSDVHFGGGIDRGSSGQGDQVAGAFTTLGNGAAAAAFLGIMYLGSRARHNDHLAETSSLAAESLLDAGIWIEVLKATFSRIRPNNPGAGQFFQYGAAHAASFPSGHSMGAFAIATVFAEEYRDRKWMPWVAYGTAGLIAFSRVALGRHYPTDVVVGGLLGNSIGRAVVDRQRSDDLDRAQRWLRGLSPIVDPSRNGYGVAYHHEW